MDRQLIDIIALVRAHAGITPDELAAQLGVSTRTVRTYVRRANEALGDVARIARRRGDGYALAADDERALDAWLARAQQETDVAAPTTPEERVQYLLNDLLNRTGWITIEDLASMACVSPRTLSNDLRGVEHELAAFDLTLEKRPYHGVRVVGRELDCRLCLANLVVKRLTPMTTTDEQTHLRRIASCVSDVTQDAGFPINSAAFQNLVVHIAVATIRIREGNYIPLDDEQLSALRGTRPWEVAAAIAARIEHELAVELPESEIAYIAIHLSGKRTVPLDDGGEAGIVISDEVWDVVSEMLEMVYRDFHFDLRNDLELRMNLARHIMPLAVRLQYHMRLDNPLLGEIRVRYPLAYAIARDASVRLSAHYGSEPSDDEVGYIALSFALALERQKAEVPKKNILVVCASGAGSARLLEYRYRSEFGADIDQIITCDVAHLDDVDLSHIDYVFTTVPLPHALPVPVREVTFFLESDEVTQVRDLLRAEPEAHPGALASYFPPRLFFAHLNVSTRDEVLGVLCAAARTADPTLPTTLEASVRKREALAGTSFGNLVAMPHPMEPVAARTFVAVALLDHEITWGEAPVRAVFLVCVAQEFQPAITAFYDGFTRMLWNRAAIDELLADQRIETLYRLLDESAQASSKQLGGGSPPEPLRGTAPRS